MASAVYQTKLTADTTQHDQALSRSAKQVYNYKTKVEKADKQLGGIISSFKKYASVIGAAKIAYDTFNKTLEQSDTWTDKWKGSLEGAGGAINQLSYQLGRLDFSNLVSNLQVAWSNAKNLYDALDALTTFNVINDEAIQEIKTQLEELRTRARQGEDVSKEIKAKEDELEQALLDGIPRIQEAKMALIKSALQWDDRYDNEGWGWADSQAEQLWNYVIELKKSNKNLEDELDRAEANLKRHTKGMTNAQMVSMPQEWKDEWTRLKKEVEAYRLAVKITDDEMRQVFEQNEALRGIRRELAQTKRQDLRYVDHTKGLKGTQKLKVDVEPNIPEGSIAALEKQIQDLKSQYNLATSDEGENGRNALKKKIEDAEEELKKLKGEMEDLPAGSLAQWENDLKTLQLQWRLATNDADRAKIQEGIDAIQAEIDRINGKVEVPVRPKTPKQELQGLIDELRYQMAMADTPELQIKIGFQIDDLEQQMEKLDEKLKTPAERIQEKVQKIQDEFEKMGNQCQDACDLISGALNAFANTGDEAANKTLKQAASIVSAFGSAIPKILALVSAQEAEAISGAVASGASLPFPYNIAAIASAVASVMSALAPIVSLMAQANSYATGGIIGGNSHIGDNNIARVNAGEMILNGTQQYRLFRLLNGSIGPQDNNMNGGNVTFHISGSDLVGVLSNNEKRNSRVR